MSRDGRHRGPPAHRWLTRPCAFAFAAKVIAMSPLSSAIGALRRLRGWSEQDLASRASIPLASLVEAEISSPTDDVSRSVARLFGVDAHALAQGKVRTANEPRARSPHAVFLFHDERSAFDSGDLEVFAKALNIGRAWLSDEIGERGRQRRHALTPIPAVGPAPRDAAQQGHSLARMVRAQLGNPTEPLPDLVELAEQTFGVPVVSQRLRSSGVAAASALDQERASAAIVLNSRGNAPFRPTLIAHELGHILFDPAADQTVQLALDGTRDGEQADLREARARGFAAELQPPRAGLVLLLGQPTVIVDVEDAAVLVRRAQDQYHTTWPITVYHLHNLFFLSTTARDELLRRTRPHPRVVARSRASGPKQPLAEITPATAWEIAEQATRRVASDLASQVDIARAEVNELAAAGKSERAGIRFALRIDDAMRGGHLRLAAHLLDRASGLPLPAKDLLGILVNTVAFRTLLISEYTRLLELTMCRLRDEGWSEQEIADTRRRLS
ncbi:MAG: ImmA/IrrE family metallo-endopeptidase [Thermomicrobiales bacterium]